MFNAIWFNKYIQIENNPVYLTKSAAKIFNFLSELFGFKTLG